MKVAFVSEHASPLAAVGGADAGGQNVHVAEMARALAARGHRVTVYTRDDGTVAASSVRMCDGVTVEQVPAGPRSVLAKDELLPHMPAFGHYLRGRWRQERPDVVHAHFWMSGVAALAGARGLDVPVVQTFHALGVVKRRHQGADDTSPAGRVDMELAVARDVDTVIATCADEAAELARMGVPTARVAIVPCGVDTRAFTRNGQAAARRGRRRILAVTRLVRRKGLDTVLHAVAEVPETDLVVAGGPAAARLADDPEYRRLTRLVAELGVAARVDFRGQVPRTDMPALIRSADLVVAVPWYEPFGMVPLEAMACGVPVVASAVGGHLDTVVDGVTGALVPPRDPGALARRLTDLLADPVLPGYGAAAAQRARSRYSWERVSRQVAAVYEQVRRGRLAA